MISMIEGIMAEQASLAIEKSLGWYLNKCNSIFGQVCKLGVHAQSASSKYASNASEVGQLMPVCSI